MTSPALFPFRVPKSFSLPSTSYSLTSLVNLNRLCLPQLRFVTASPRPVSASWDVCADLLIGGSGLPPVTGEGGGETTTRYFFRENLREAIERFVTSRTGRFSDVPVDALVPAEPKRHGSAWARHKSRKRQRTTHDTGAKRGPLAGGTAIQRIQL